MTEGIFLLMCSIICFLVCSLMKNREKRKALEKMNEFNKPFLAHSDDSKQ